MRIAELSRRSGVSIATIKYYLREGLLPPGEPTGRNQALYQPAHLDRLRLIRALREVGGLSVSAAGQVLATLDDPPESAHALMGQAHRAVAPSPAGSDTDPVWTSARDRVAEWVRELGWLVHEDAPALDQLADVFATLHRLGQEDLLTCLPAYAEAALTIARAEVATAAARPLPGEVVAAVVVGTVLGERLLAAVRLLAHEHVSATTLPAPE